MVIQTSFTGKTNIELLVSKNSSHIVVFKNSALDAERINVKIQSSSAVIELTPEPIPLKLATELCSRSEGSTNPKNGIYQITPAGNTLLLPTDHTIIVNLSGLDASASYTVETMDLPTLTNQFLYMKEETIMANTSGRDVNFVSNDMSIVYAKDAMTEVKLVHMTGTSTDFTPKTEEVFQQLANDVTFADSADSSTDKIRGDYNIYDVVELMRVEFKKTKSATRDYYLVSVRSL